MTTDQRDEGGGQGGDMTTDQHHEGGGQGGDMTTDRRREGAGKPRAKKAARRRVASESPASKSGKESSASKSGKESDVSVTTTNPVSAGTSATGYGGGPKGWGDFLGDFLPDLAGTAATTLGIDPRVAGQTVSQVMSIFGIGGPGKAFTPTIPKDMAISQLQQGVAPYLSDPAFAKALGKWMQAAIEPVQAHKEGKAYQPSVDLSKSWISDAVDWVGDQASKVDWQQVGKIGMELLPYAVALV
jgi:hypothetical protein